MKNFYIYVDGMAYLGEDPEKTYKCDIGGNGWNVSNHGSQNVIILSNESLPKKIEGNRNLKSELDRILIRMKNEVMNPEKIVIMVFDES